MTTRLEHPPTCPTRPTDWGQTLTGACAALAPVPAPLLWRLTDPPTDQLTH